MSSSAQEAGYFIAAKSSGSRVPRWCAWTRTCEFGDCRRRRCRCAV